MVVQATDARGLGLGDRGIEKRDHFGLGRVEIADGLEEEVREREGSRGTLEFVGLRGLFGDEGHNGGT